MYRMLAVVVLPTAAAAAALVVVAMMLMPMIHQALVAAAAAMVIVAQSQPHLLEMVIPLPTMATTNQTRLHPHLLILLQLPLIITNLHLVTIRSNQRNRHPMIINNLPQVISLHNLLLHRLHHHHLNSLKHRVFHQLLLQLHLLQPANLLRQPPLRRLNRYPVAQVPQAQRAPHHQVC